MGSGANSFNMAAAASTAPPLRRTRERRGAAAPAHRRARSTASLDDELLGALEKAAAGAGGEASQDRGGCSAGSIIDWLAHCASVRPNAWKMEAIAAAIAAPRRSGGCDFGPAEDAGRRCLRSAQWPQEC